MHIHRPKSGRRFSDRYSPGEGCFGVLPTALIAYSVDTLRVLTEHSRIHHVTLHNLGVKNAEVIMACLRTSWASQADGPRNHVTYNLLSAAHDFGRGIGHDTPKFTTVNDKLFSDLPLF